MTPDMQRLITAAMDAGCPRDSAERVVRVILLQLRHPSRTMITASVEALNRRPRRNYGTREKHKIRLETAMEAVMGEAP